jgi:flavin reductase (DIM6/NTAB) family NADH-FMN oxidoreductase RutF
MFYEPSQANHGLPKNPFNSLVIPRPIGWLTTLSKDGVVNLSPYSFFNAVCYRPPTVMFAAGAGHEADGLKDTLRNVLDTREFVCNLVTWDNREQMNQTSATLPKEVDELALAGLTPLSSERVSPPRVAESPIHLECRMVKSVELPGWEAQDRYVVVFGEVVGVHIQDDCITEEGRVDLARIRPLGRLGYNDYVKVEAESIFEMIRPD